MVIAAATVADVCGDVWRHDRDAVLRDAERAPSPPSLMSAATGSGLMSKDSVANPFLCKLDAMGRPIRPRR
jgi:hypothetical protein